MIAILDTRKPHSHSLETALVLFGASALAVFLVVAKCRAIQTIHTERQHDKPLGRFGKVVVVVVEGILFIRALALIYKMENEIGVQNSEQACDRFGVMMKNVPMSPTIIRAHHIIRTALICLMPRLCIHRQTDRQTDKQRETWG